MAYKQISLPKQEIRIPAGHPLMKLQWIAGGVGILSLAGAVILGMNDPHRFFPSYLVAFLFFLTISLGALFFVVIQFATRAGWSVAVRRVAENIMGTMPFLVLLFIPLTAGFTHLYHWMNAETVAQDAILQGKSGYLNATFFWIRTAVYLISWSLIAYWFRRKSLSQDELGGTRITRTLQTASAPVIAWLAITTTFAAFDWIMSLDAHWYSAVFGVYVFAGAFVSNLALMIFLLLLLQKNDLLTNLVNSEHLHDLGKLMFGFVVFWAYIAFSQFMLIWYANIPEETLWFAHRWHHGWEYASILLAAGHFVIPFFLLISRPAKRNRLLLTLATLWILAMHYLDMY